MVNSVSLACVNYFEGLDDLSTFNTNSSSKNALGILKVASYFTLFIPLFVGLIYGISSLIGRISIGNSQSPENQKTSSVSRKVFGQTIEEQLEKLFKSSTKTQKLFMIDETKIGVIFNPLGESLKVGFMTVKDSVVLVSNKSIPDKVVSRITRCMPENCTHSTLSLGSINGSSIFAVLGFE